MNVARLRLAPAGETVFPPAYGLYVPTRSCELAVPHTPVPPFIDQSELGR
jgi:hypothetical protein